MMKKERNNNMSSQYDPEWAKNNQKIVENICPSLLLMPSTACVYGIKIMRIIDQKERWAYIGESKNFKDCRLSDHAKNICLKHNEKYGIRKEEINIVYKFSIEVLDNYIDDDTKRKEFETYRIKTLQPYTQSNNYPKMKSVKGYNGGDICIQRAYRRQALLDAFKQ